MSLPLNGTSQCAVITYNAALELPDADWSVAGWFKLGAESGTAYNWLLSWFEWDGTSSINTLIYEVSHLLASCTEDWDGKSATMMSTTVVGNDTTHWQHLAIIRASGVVKQYVNGVLEGTGATEHTANILKALDWYLGWDSGMSANYAFKGSIAEWAKWNRALTVGVGSELIALSSGAGTDSPKGAKPGDIATPAWWLPLYEDDDFDIGALTASLVGSPAAFDAADHPVAYSNPRAVHHHRQLMGAA